MGESRLSARSGRFGLAAKVSTGHPQSPFLAKKEVPPSPLPKFADFWHFKYYSLFIIHYFSLIFYVLIDKAPNGTV